MNIKNYFRKIESISKLCEKENIAARKYIGHVLTENKKEVLELINSKKKLIEITDFDCADELDWGAENHHKPNEKYLLDSVVKDIEDLCIVQKCHFPLGIHL